MSNLFNRRVYLQVDPIIFNIRKINSQFFATVLCHPSPSCLCFSAHPPFSFRDSDFLINYHVIDEKSLHSFPSMLLPGESHEDTNGASSSSFFILDSSQDLSIIPFYCFKCLLMLVHLIIIHSSLFICSGVLKISQKTRLVIQDQFNLFRGCYLILAI